MKRFIIIKDANLTQKILNITGKFNTKHLRWNQNKGVLTAKKYIIDIRGDIPDVLIDYYAHSRDEIKEILKQSEWSTKET